MKLDTETLKRARVGKGLTRQALAAAAGLSPETLRHLELGTHQPRIATVKRLADALEVEVLDLFEAAA